jgi:hypothetical protein
MLMGEWDILSIIAGDQKITAQFIDTLNNAAKANYYYVISEHLGDLKPNDEDEVREDSSVISDDVEGNGYVFGSLSTTGFVGVVIRGVALIVLAVGVMVIATRRKMESRTGLIERDE